MKRKHDEIATNNDTERATINEMTNKMNKMNEDLIAARATIANTTATNTNSTTNHSTPTKALSNSANTNSFLAHMSPSTPLRSPVSYSHFTNSINNSPSLAVSPFINNGVVIPEFVSDTGARDHINNNKKLIWPVDIKTTIIDLSDKIFEARLTIERQTLEDEVSPKVPTGTTCTIFGAGKTSKNLLMKLLAICELPMTEESDISKLLLPTLASFTTAAAYTSRGVTSGNSDIIYSWLTAVNDVLTVAQVNTLVVNRWWVILLQINKLLPYSTTTGTNNTDGVLVITQRDINGLHRYLHNLVIKLHKLILIAATGESQVLPSIRSEIELEQDAKANIATGFINSGNSNTYLFGNGNVNYLWRRIAINYFRKDINTGNQLSKELDLIAYDTDTAGGNIVNHQCMLNLFNAFDKHAAKARMYSEPVNESTLAAKLVSLVPPELATTIDIFMLTNKDSVSLAGIKEIILQTTINILARSSATASANFVGGRLGSGNNSNSSKGAHTRCSICNFKNHTTQEHNACKQCNRSHHPDYDCQRKSSRGTDHSGAGGTTNSKNPKQ